MCAFDCKDSGCVRVVCWGGWEKTGGKVREGEKDGGRERQRLRERPREDREGLCVDSRELVVRRSGGLWRERAATHPQHMLAACGR